MPFKKGMLSLRVSMLGKNGQRSKGRGSVASFQGPDQWDFEISGVALRGVFAAE